MKRSNVKQLIIIALMLGAVITGGALIWLRWPTSCMRYDTESTPK